MSPSVKNGLVGLIAIVAGFVAAIEFSVIAPQQFSVLAENAWLLNAWRCLAAVFAIILTRAVLDRSLPRIRVLSSTK